MTPFLSKTSVVVVAAVFVGVDVDDVCCCFCFCCGGGWTRNNGCLDLLLWVAMK